MSALSRPKSIIYEESKDSEQIEREVSSQVGPINGKKSSKDVRKSVVAPTN